MKPNYNKKHKLTAVLSALVLCVMTLSAVFALSGCAASAKNDAQSAETLTLELDDSSKEAQQGNSPAPQDGSQYSLDTITKVPDFSAIDQQGNPVDQSVFANADYTLLVFWATWCGPCVAEIPELAAAQEALLGMNVQIVGICEDGKSNRESALEILQANNATYVNIMPSDQFYDDFVSLCFTYPSAMLIDSQGNVVRNQFAPERDANAIVSQASEMLQTSDTTAAPAASDAQKSDDAIAAYYDAYKEDMLANGHTENDTAIKNLSLFQEMNRKAYAYTTDQYYLSIGIEIDGEKRKEIRRFVTDGSYREEEYSKGDIAYVTVYNRQTDEHVMYEASSANTTRVSNASYKGYSGFGILHGSMDITGNNAVLGELSETEYEGRTAIVSTYARDDFECKVLFDKETGVLLRFDQKYDGNTYSEIYTYYPNTAFDASIFEFDVSMLSADTKGK